MPTVDISLLDLGVQMARQFKRPYFMPYSGKANLTKAQLGEQVEWLGEEIDSLRKTLASTSTAYDRLWDEAIKVPRWIRWIFRAH